MRFLLLLALAWAAFASQALAKGYPLTGEDCDGFPKVAVGTMDGVCIGLVLQSGENLKLVKPRKIVQVMGRDAFLLTDMGGWNGNRGSLWLIEWRGGAYAARKLKSKLNLPHQIVTGPGGRYYLGEAHQIVSFELDAGGAPVGWRVDVPGLPDLGDNLHPLTHFIFMENNDLLVNVGAATDNCKNEMETGVCVGRKKSGLLRLYRYEPGKDGWSPDFEIYATGLRNSMALVRHTSGTVLQAENGVDFKDAGKPYEEINIVEKGGDYGWPYCYDHDTAHPDWAKPAHCRGPGYNPPWSLMPPHVAPLDMMYYTGDLFPQLKGKLIVPWHGYRRTGHRIAAYEVDEMGRPVRQLDGAVYRSDPAEADAAFPEHRYTPGGAPRPVARHVEVAGVWNKVPGVRPRGAPVGVLQAEDGSIWIVDDKNSAVLRMAPGEAWRPSGDGGANVVAATSYSEDQALSGRLRVLLAERCVSCHEFLKSARKGTVAHALVREGWLSAPLAESKVAAMLLARNMPPEKPLRAEEFELIGQWFKSLRAGN